MNILRDGKVKTRKEHRCHGCRKTIPKGTEIYSQTVADEGTVYTIYMCNECINWCKDKKCNDCITSECAFEGYIKECIEQQ
ncbi:hypothetical protein [Brassicibacter mesophilus]|uniref:hypothetical protein n=1 Tax=Brassicibacter mesophilus TaxID=745119 RepID=UPI003D23AE34